MNGCSSIRWVCLLIASATFFAGQAEVFADDAEVRKKRERSREVEVPVDIGVGPSFFVFGNPLVDDGLLSGPVYEDQPLHTGLRFEAAGVIDYEWVRENSHAVPRKYRRRFKPGTEIKVRPLFLSLIPRNLYISPKVDDTAIYGATWRLLGVGVSLLRSESSSFGARAGLLGTYAYIDSESFDSPTHFVRPGLSLGLAWNTMFTDTVGVSLGWDSNLYIPQDIGGGIASGGGDDALWHIGEAFLMLHYRFPFTTEL